MLPERVLDPGTARILAIRLDNVGDVVMLGPALRSLRAALPRASITLMCSPAGAQAAPLLPWIDDVLVYRAVWQDARAELPLDPGREMELVSTLRRRAFDAALIFTSFSQSPLPPGYVCYLAGIPIRAGQADAFGGSVLSPAVEPAPWAAHQVDRNLNLLGGLGVPIGSRQLELRVPAAAIAAADDLLQTAGIDGHEPFVVIAPGASASARRYDSARFGVVAAELTSRTRWPVVLVGSDRDHGIEAEVVAAASRGGRVPRSLVGRTSVPELAAIISRSRLVVANDSAAMHLADAFGRPMVVTFSGTDLESQWQPRRSAASLLRTATTCAPCYRFDCPYDNACLEIAPERVIEAALRVIGSHESPPKATSARRTDSPAPPIHELVDGDIHEPAHPHLARPRELPVLPGAGAS